MHEPPPLPPASSPDLVRCAYSGIMRESVHMLRLGDVWIAPEHKDAAVEYLQQGGQFAYQHGVRHPMPGFLDGAKRGLLLLRESWRMLLVLHVMNLPHFLVLQYSLTRPLVGGGELGKLLFYLALLWISTAVGSAALRQYSVLWAGGAPALGDMLLVGVRRSPGVFLIGMPNFVVQSLVVTIHLWPSQPAVGIVAMSFFIPGLVAVVLLSFTPLFIVDRGERIFKSIKSGYTMLKGHFWALLLYTLLQMLTSDLTRFLTNALVPQHALGGAYGQLHATISWAFSITQLFWLAFFFVLYKGILGEKEAYLPEEDVSRPTARQPVV